MFCIVSFIVLSVLGIFSASNRKLAREALDCVGRRVSFRPCNTGFDEKIKAKLLGKVITKSEGFAKFLNKNFELLSWAFFVLMIASLVFFVRGLFLFYTTGSCNGLNSAGFCAFDPHGANNQVSAPAVCPVPPADGPGHYSLDGFDLSRYPTMHPESKDKIVMVGCYTCEYTHKTYPDILNLAGHYGASLTFIDWPVHQDGVYLGQVTYAARQLDADKFWKLNELLFAAERTSLHDDMVLRGILQEAGYDPNAVISLANDPQTFAAVSEMNQKVQSIGLPGTPSVFIKDETLIGPKPYRVYAIALKGLLFWLR